MWKQCIRNLNNVILSMRSVSSQKTQRSAVMESSMKCADCNSSRKMTLGLMRLRSKEKGRKLSCIMIRIDPMYLSLSNWDILLNSNHIKNIHQNIHLLVRSG